MTSWIGPARVRGRGLVMVTAFLAFVTVFLIPAAAEASTYRWKDAVDGVWTTAANWEHVPGSGPVGSGYPNATGDVAEFNQAYTAKRTVTIDDDVAITVGTILFDVRRDVTILAEGDSSRLIVDNGAASAAEKRTISRAAGTPDLGDTVRFAGILETGDVVTRHKTLGPRQRLTVNVAAEDDPRLANASVSTVVEADVPIVSERSMYWPGEAPPLGEGHNSAGVVRPATRGLAEGRVGGPLPCPSLTRSEETS